MTSTEPRPAAPFRLATAVCVDPDEHGRTIKYASIGSSPKIRRRAYWRCAFNLCWTARRVYPDIPIVVYTNDRSELTFHRVDVRSRLEDLGVDIVQLPFERFDPGDASRCFRNGFYKLEVLEHLAALGGPSLLLDNDCVIHKRAASLERALGAGTHLVLQDTLQRAAEPHARTHVGLSMADMGDVYRRIDADFPTPHPVAYGGELVGGPSDLLGRLAIELKKAFDDLLPEHDRFRFHTGMSIFDGDEQLLAFVVNRGAYQIFDTMNDQSVRAMTKINRQEWPANVLEIPIWHLPLEKTRGYRVLFRHLAQGRLDMVPQDQLTDRLGAYLGLPTRAVGRYIDIYEKVEAQVRTLFLYHLCHERLLNAAAERVRPVVQRTVRRRSASARRDRRDHPRR